MTLTTQDKEAAIAQLEWERMMAKRDCDRLIALNPSLRGRYKDDWWEVDRALFRQIRTLNPYYGERE